MFIGGGIMPIENYGVWVAKPVRVSAERAEDDPESPHIHLFYDDGTGGNFGGARRASINVKSLSSISELVYWVVRDFTHPIVDEIRDLNQGFHELESRPGGAAMDYIRGNLMDFSRGRILPHDVHGGQNDIIDFVMPDLQMAIEREATIYLFGEPYGDRQGIHDVHMNQGSAARFARFNGVWQDGGIVIHFEEDERFDAIFLAFASQAVHTDETTGHALPGSQNFAQLLGREPGGGEQPISDDLRVAILAALVNPEGPENQPRSTGRPESVYLLNRTSEAISMDGWSILNRVDHAQAIESGITLSAGEVRTFEVPNAPLSNSGGLITLLDQDGNKVDGVSYTKKQGRDEGKVVVFR
jgi:uncharacterized protein YukJ